MALMMQFKVSSSGAGFSPLGRRLAIIDSSDITLASNDGGYFRAHQSVLAAASPLFVFSAEQASAPALIRHLNIDGRSMYWMLDLIYDGTVQIPLQDFLQFKREAWDFQLRSVTWVRPKEVPVHIPNSLENLFLHLQNQVQVQEQNQEEEEEEEQQQVQVEEEADWDQEEEDEEQDQAQGVPVEQQYQDDPQEEDEEHNDHQEEEQEHHEEEAQVQDEDFDWDFPQEEEQEQQVEEDEDHAIDQQAQDNANVEDEEPIDVLHGRFYLGFEIRFND